MFSIDSNDFQRFIGIIKFLKLGGGSRLRSGTRKKTETPQRQKIDDDNDDDDDDNVDDDDKQHVITLLK